jgi:photosystem II stability/assembly factor-like uncharacterized protein
MFIVTRKFICIFAMLLSLVEISSAQGTAFNYQGQLYDNGGVANGTYDLRFWVYDSTNNPGTIIAGPVTNSAVFVTNGLFTIQTDFGSGVFNGFDRWLQIAVRTNGAATFTNLSPRQKITPTPYAIFANSASNLVGSLASTQLVGALPASAFVGFTNVVALTNGANLFRGTFTGNGAGITNVSVSNLVGVLTDAQLPTNTAFVNSNQTFSASNNFSGTNFFGGANTFTNFKNSFSGSFFGNGLVGWIATNSMAVQAEIDHGYLLTNSQLVTVTLPPSPGVGDIVRISGAGASGWKVAQVTGQSIIGNFLGFGNSLWTPSDANNLTWESVAASADGTRMIAAAQGTGLYISYNSGANWTQINPNTFQWRAVASSSDGSKLFAAVFGGSIYTNSGTGFSAVTSTASKNWVSIACSSDGSRAVAIVNMGGLFTTANSGATWTQRTSGLPNAGVANWFSVASSANGSNLVVGINGGHIFTSTDAGVTWSQSGDAPIANWAGVTSSSDGSKLAATILGGAIYTSTNSGTTWTAKNAPNANWETIASSSDGSKLAAVANAGPVYTSSDYGSTWTQANVTNGASWFSIASSSDGSKLAAGILGGGIYISQLSAQTTSTTGTNGFIIGGQGAAVELQYIGNSKWMPVSSAGTIWAR